MIKRALHTIAADVARHWPNVNFAAKPYLRAMSEMDDIGDAYFYDSGASVVRYFLSNARSWRGADAKRIKAELKGML